MAINVNIKLVTERDYTNTKFLGWLYKLDEFNTDEQDTIFSLFHSGITYGYFINNIMRGFIRIKSLDVYSINMLFVDKSFQNCGIGSALLQLAINKFGNKDIVLNVFTDNYIAINMYKKFGFVIEETISCSNEPECPLKFIHKKQYRMRRMR
jgi:ribosomal protein S18 acetylase RimI-like enzyme|uniref:Acetyltransferase domain containing protein n=1 Tax=Myoviridae sp. ctqfO1 TaxID=2827710 RepID=A0A8S5T2C9_9CAUD|nr:MAG TPA: acetyltransferase domain containing protein [Myoviridae sp. ctqfO1]